MLIKVCFKKSLLLNLLNMAWCVCVVGGERKSGVYDLPDQLNLRSWYLNRIFSFHYSRGINTSHYTVTVNRHFSIKSLNSSFKIATYHFSLYNTLIFSSVLKNIWIELLSENHILHYVFYWLWNDFAAKGSQYIKYLLCLQVWTPNFSFIMTPDCGQLILLRL